MHTHILNSIILSTRSYYGNPCLYSYPRHLYDRLLLSKTKIPTGHLEKRLEYLLCSKEGKQTWETGMLSQIV